MVFMPLTLQKDHMNHMAMQMLNILFKQCKCKHCLGTHSYLGGVGRIKLVHKCSVHNNS